jgi:ABC-type transport system involved in multi-copper enzyme maturation permease subunit
MSISPPRYAAAPIDRRGRMYRTFSIARQEFLNQSGGATWAVVGLTYATVVLVITIDSELASFVGQLTTGTFESPYESTVLPLLILLVATIVGAGCIAEDIRSRSIVLYLSRPIHLIDYLAAKMASTGSWILLATVGPGLIGVGIVAALGAVSLSISISAAAGFLATGLLVAVFFTGLAVAFSSLTSRSLYAGVAIFGVVLSLSIGVGVVFGITGNPAVLYADPLTNLRSVAEVAFGVPGPHPTDPVASAIVLVGSGVALAAIAAWRLSRVEVVGE